MAKAITAPTNKKLGQLLRSEGVDFVWLQFSDIEGQIKQITIPARQWTEVVDHGQWFDGSSIQGFARTVENDMYLMPDPSTFTLIPWESGTCTARVICDVLLPNGDPFPGDPRYVLKRQLDRARGMGFEYNIAPELEFFLFRRHEDGEVLPLQPLDQAGYFDISIDISRSIRRKIVESLTEMGVVINAFHHEVAEGQNELDMRYGPGLQLADSTVTARIAAKAVAHQHGLFCSFLPKPMTGKSGSGMHVHQSLLDPVTGRNLMYDDGHPYRLSQTALHFIAGQLEHAKAMACVVAPLVNSYKRLVSGFEAPVKICWGRTNRGALIRVPRTTRDRSISTRCELRSPDPSANPYLAFAVMLAAGLDGIEKEMQPPNPLEEDLFRVTDRRHGYESLPDSLGAAIEYLRDNHVLADALGPHLHDTYVEAKTQEWIEFRTHVSTWELNQYLATY